MEIDNSTLNSFSKCNIYGALRHALHRVPKRESEAIFTGTEFHEIARKYFKGLSIKNDLLNYEEKLQAWLLKNEQPSATARAKPLTIFRAINVLIKQFPIKRIKTSGEKEEILILTPEDNQPLYRVKHVEVPFKVPLGPHTFIGRIDLIIEDMNGSWYIVDLKTSRYARSASWRNKFRMSTQLTGYIYAASFHTNKPITGGLIFPLAILVDPIYAGTIRASRTETEIESWQYQTIAYANIVENIINKTKTSEDLINIIPTGKYSDQCVQYGNCSFFEICKQNYNPAIINLTTKRFIWNPLDELDNDKEEN